MKIVHRNLLIIVLTAWPSHASTIDFHGLCHHRVYFIVNSTGIYLMRTMTLNDLYNHAALKKPTSEVKILALLPNGKWTASTANIAWTGASRKDWCSQGYR
jgi:hypothetical protein